LWSLSHSLKLGPKKEIPPVQVSKNPYLVSTVPRWFGALESQDSHLQTTNLAANHWRSAASPSKKIGQLLWKQRPRMEFKKYVKPPSVDCGCVHINNYIYTHRYTITYARITDCKCILPTNHEPELWPFWDSYPAPNPNHPFSRDVGRDEIHPEKSPMASQIYPQHWSAFPSYNWSPWYSYHIPMIFSMFATADLGLPANDFQLVLINPIQPEPGPWPHRL